MLDEYKFDSVVHDLVSKTHDRTSQHIRVVLTVFGDFHACAEFLRLQGVDVRVCEGKDGVLFGKVSVDDLEGILSTECWIMHVQGVQFTATDQGPSPDGFE